MQLELPSSEQLRNCSRRDTAPFRPVRASPSPSSFQQSERENWASEAGRGPSLSHVIFQGSCERTVEDRREQNATGRPSMRRKLAFANLPEPSRRLPRCDLRRTSLQYRPESYQDRGL